MAAKLTFYPVDNGAMTLVELESGKTILIDINIREKADDPNDTTPDVAKQLKDRLKRDSEGRLYVDAFLLSHPDEDHCRGLRNHFHLGLPSEFSKSADKILIREVWSSPMVFRRASKLHTLCSDAKAFNSEAKRRVKLFREGTTPSDGNRILILGEDQDGKTDDLTSILVKADDVFSKLNGQVDQTFSARLLAPHPKHQEETEEDISSKNHSSTILNISIGADGNRDACRFLSCGDAEVAIWERLWDHHSGRIDWLGYDILETPHHCSWHSLSYDSWREKQEDAVVSQGARNALSQTRKGAFIVANSKAIKDDDNDPPCIRAKREYKRITDAASGAFICVGEHPSQAAPKVLEFEITKDGPLKKDASESVSQVGSPKPSRLTETALGVLRWVGRFAVPHRELPNWKVADVDNIPLRVTVSGGFEGSKELRHGDSVQKARTLLFEALRLPNASETIHWQVVNTGQEAEHLGQLRGQMLHTGKTSRTEQTRYTGEHWVECFIVKTVKMGSAYVEQCIARSGEFLVRIS